MKMPEASQDLLQLPRSIFSSIGDVLSEPVEKPSRNMDPEDLRKSLVYLLCMRIVLLSTLLGLNTWEIFSSGMDSLRAHMIFGVFGATYALSLLNVVLLRRIERPLPVGYAQLVIDVLLATLVIYVTGSAVSISLYLIVIIGAAVLMGRTGAIAIAAISGIAFACLTSGVLPTLDPNSRPSQTSDILAVYLSLVAIALLSTYLAKKLEMLGRIADSQARHLCNIEKEQRQILDDISEGIVTLDLDQAISSINQAACSIIGLGSPDTDSIMGKKLTALINTGDSRSLESILEGESGDSTAVDLQIQTPDKGRVHLSCSVRKMVDSDGNPRGRLLLFNDISHVRSIEEQLSLHEQMAKLLAAPSTSEDCGSFAHDVPQVVGESAIMKSVYSLVEKVAPGGASVLIYGESGTGKELIARAIHRLSSRGDKPFVAINCGAIPENLIESELFGHVKGAFTGAIRDNPGLIRRAHGGTVFLDEVGELPLHMQSKLLRFLQEKRIRPVGGTEDADVDVRIVSATNKNLRSEISKGSFREDLYYRLDVVTIPLPPLRERREDIPLLVKHFVDKLSSKDRPTPRISPEALALLASYDFPGNVRELENMLERALVIGGNAILPEHLPQEVLRSSSRKAMIGIVGRNGNGLEGAKSLDLPIELDECIRDLERLYLLRALEEAEGIKKRAAELLGMNFRSFRYRLKKYGLSDTSAPEVPKDK